LERKTITSTPSIISDRCRRTAKRHSDFVAVTAGGYPTRRHNNFNSAVRRRRRLPTTGSVRVTRLVRAAAVAEALARARSKGWSPRFRVCP
jgi:hypothetical protein